MSGQGLGITLEQYKFVLSTFSSGDFPFSGITEVNLDNGLLSSGVEGVYLKRFMGIRDALPTSAGVFADLWEGDNDIYNLPSTPLSLEISSTAVGDTQDIKLIGMDANWEEQIVTVTLTGRTPVTVPNTWIRTCNIENVGTTDLAGDVWLYDAGSAVVLGKPSDDNVQRLVITTGTATNPHNTSFLSVTSVPANFTGFVFSINTSVNKGSGAAAGAKEVDVACLIKDFGKVWTQRDMYGINNNGTGLTQDDNRVPLVVPEKSDITLRANSNSNNTKGVCYIRNDANIKRYSNDYPINRELN